MATCKQCGLENHGGRCLPCRKLWQVAYNIKRYAKNSETIKARVAKYYKENKEKALACCAKCRSDNPTKYRAYKGLWRKANPEKSRASSARARALDPIKANAATAKSKKDHPEVHIRSEHARRAKKRLNGGVLSPGITAKLFTLQKGKCACCGLPLGKDFHLDHIMPLALGGANKDNNMQLLRARCNHQKHARHPIDFMQSRGFLL